MKVEELKSTLERVIIPDEIQERLIENCLVKKGKPSFRINKSLRYVFTCMAVLFMIIGALIYFDGKTSQGKKLVIDYSPVIIKVGTKGNVFSKLSQNIEIQLGDECGSFSRVGGFPFQFIYPEATIEITVDKGRLFLDNNDEVEEWRKFYSVFEEGLLFWSPISPDITTWGNITDFAIIEYRILFEDHIVGMGVIKINVTEESVYMAKLILSIDFPKVDGKYQKIRDEDLRQLRLKALKQEAP